MRGEPVAGQCVEFAGHLDRPEGEVVEITRADAGDGESPYPGESARLVEGRGRWPGPV